MKRMGVLFSLAVVPLILVGIHSKSFAQDVRQQLAASSTLEEIKKRGRMVVGLATFVPSAMIGKDGKLIGFQVDVARAIATAAGVELELVNTAFPGIIPGLLTGKFDTIIAGMEMKSSRNLQVNFAGPYNWGVQGMLANKKMTSNFKVTGPKTTMQDDFNRPDVTFAMRRGAAPIQLVKKHFPKAKILQFDDDQQAVQDVLNGKSHAFLSSEPKVSYQVVDNPDVLYKPYGAQSFGRWPQGIAIRKGDVDFLNFLTNWITINTENGFIAERAGYWYNFSRPWLSMVEAK